MLCAQACTMNNAGVDSDEQQCPGEKYVRAAFFLMCLTSIVDKIGCLALRECLSYHRRKKFKIKFEKRDKNKKTFVNVEQKTLNLILTVWSHAL